MFGGSPILVICLLSGELYRESSVSGLCYVACQYVHAVMPMPEMHSSD